MARFAIFVEFHIRPDAFARFRDLVGENAAASVRDEPGCRRFDILLPRDGEGPVVRLYEIYDDEAAFQAHLETPHYARFKEATDPLIESRTIGRFDVIENAAA